MKRIIFSLVAILLGVITYAQNEADALRYSSQYTLGTARFTGLGGAMGALGGDMSSIHINPAAIGIYRFGDFSFTPALEINDLKTKIHNEVSSLDRSTLVINNAGFVLTNELNDPFWKSINFGISYNRLNTYNDHLNIKTTYPVSRSLMQDFANNATGYAPKDLDEFTTKLAWQGYVIDEIDSVNHVYSGRAYQGDVRQVQDAVSSGRLGETALTIGANYNDILYLGASFNFLTPYFESITNTTETPLDIVHTDLTNYTYNEILETSGIGYNLRLGAIVKAGKHLRFGASVQTPTSFSLTDEYRTKLTSELRNPNEEIENKSDLSIFEYRIRTPWRYMASVAGVLGKKAIVSFQYEYTDYASARLKNSREFPGIVDFSNTNDAIRSFFQSSHILRAGAEYRFTPEIYARGGFAYFSNPNKANTFSGVDLNRYHYAGGLGYRAAAWSLDLSYQLARQKEIYKTHNVADIATLTNNRSSIVATLSLRM